MREIVFAIESARWEAAGYEVRNYGAGEGSRTPDLLITNQLLYQLSYASSAQYKTPPRRGMRRLYQTPEEGVKPMFGRIASSGAAQYFRAHA